MISFHKFISRNEEKLTRKVSLEILAREHRRKHNCASALVVDGVNILRPIFLDLQHQHCGGQWAEYISRMKKFVDSMRSIGIEMIFYFDGSFKEMTKEELESREKHDGVRMAKMFESLRKGAIPESTRPLLPGEPSFFRYLLRYECECTVHIALTNLHKEVALFAKQKRECFAILANDINYLIFETKPLISAKSLDLCTMKSITFLRKELLVLTRLESKQLPLLACMIGNSVISTKSLSNLHKRLSPRYGADDLYLVDKAINMIRQREWLSGQFRCFLSEIAEVIEIHEQVLRAGLDYYDLSKNLFQGEEETFASLQTLQILRDRCHLCQLTSTIFTLFTARKVRYGISVEDPNDDTIPASAVIFRPIRHRIYGLLFNGCDVDVSEWCVHKNKNFLEPEVVKCLPINVDVKVPPVEDLLTGDVDPEVRWKLFIACLGISIPRTELDTIDPHFISMCCILNVLLRCEQLQLKKWELKSFICQAVYPNAKEGNHAYRLEVEIDPRAASLLGILVRGMSIVLKALAVCGLPFPLREAMPWRCIEGKIFHFCYNLFRESHDDDIIVEELCNNDAYAIRAFRNMYRVTTIGTVLN